MAKAKVIRSTYVPRQKPEREIVGVCGRCGEPEFRMSWNSVCDSAACDNSSCEKYRNGRAIPIKGKTSIPLPPKHKSTRGFNEPDETTIFYSNLRRVWNGIRSEEE